MADPKKEHNIACVFSTKRRAKKDCAVGSGEICKGRHSAGHGIAMNSRRSRGFLYGMTMRRM
jgi:hypothetical protein